MATFQKNGRQDFGPLNLYQPDYEFLTKVYGTRQAQYDRGFNAVKSLYNSYLNEPLTNTDNQEFRKSAFKKLQDSLRSTVHADFAKNSHVKKAFSLIEPISKDKELAYDLAITKHNNKQREIMNSYKTSPDADKRAQYNDYSAMHIANSEEDLRNAKRGDGSITSAQPGEFLPFEDIGAFLSAAAKEDNLEIKLSGPTGTGYILTSTNGEKAIPIFEEWAKMRMGDRFNRQLRMIGEVQAEGSIRDKINNQGMSREEAVRAVASENELEIKTATSSRGSDLEENLSRIQKQIKIFDEHYGQKGFPTNKPHLKEKYDELLEQEKIHKDRLNQVKGDLKNMNEDTEYIANNLHNLYTNTAYTKEAHNWAKTTALATYEAEYKPDTTYIAKARMALSDRHHQDDIKMKKLDLMLKSAQLHLDKEKLKLATFKELNDQNGGNSSGKSGGGTSSGGSDGTTNIGDYEYISTTINENPIPGTQILDKAVKVNQDKMFGALLDPQKGLVKITTTPQNFNAVHNAVEKLRLFAEGNGEKLTTKEKKTLTDYGVNIGADLMKFDDRKDAGYALDAIMLGSYDQAIKLMSTYKEAGVLSKYVTDVKSFNNLLDNHKQALDKKEKINEALTQIGRYITDNNGIKDEFKGAVLIGYDRYGNEQYDLSNISDEAKYELQAFIPQAYRNLAAPASNVAYIPNPSAAEYKALFTEAIVPLDGMDEDTFREVQSRFNSMPQTALDDLFGEQLEGEFDPIDNSAVFTLKVDPKSSVKAKDKLPGGEFKFKLKYETLQSSPELGRFRKIMQKNMPNSETPIRFEPFVNNYKSRITSNSYEDATGMSFDATGMEDTDGNYGINFLFTSKDPYTNSSKTEQVFMPVQNPANPLAFNDLDVFINSIYRRYLGYIEEYENDNEY